ncbi:GntR family transcriptional regulator [Paralimibaculum aggregatum]|nr:GntR family transcriptional regulator [Limibaculum sp. NKW23]
MRDDALDRKDAFHAALRRDILTLRLAPGTALDEAALALQYGLSRPPLREVLRQMAGEGYLELRRNRGAAVAPMTHTTLRNFFLAAPMIYAAISRLAAQNASAAQVAGLKEIQRQFRAAVTGGEAEQRVTWNDRFHAAIGEIADNVYLLPSLRRLLIDHARIGMTFYRPRRAGPDSRLARAADQHDALIAAIEAGDEETAAAVTLDHWALSRDMIETFVTPEGLDAPLGDSPQRQAGEPQ